MSEFETEEIRRLTQLVERERRARLEADAIAERGLRDLYEKQRAVSLLEGIAAAANEAPTADKAIRFALRRICEHTGWPLGHVFHVTQNPEDGDLELTPGDVWHAQDTTRFEPFRQATGTTRFPTGVGLPGRTHASGKAEWINDFAADADFPRAAEAVEVGLKAAFAFPVLVGTEVAAVLEFFAHEWLEPNEELLGVMAYVGAQIGRVIERKRGEERLIHNALHDPLTTLPNRTLFLERLEYAMNRARRYKNYRFAVLFIDLDRFKIINDSLGHLIGDQLIIEVSRRLHESLRLSDLVSRTGSDEPSSSRSGSDDTIARLGGDEFTILIDEIRNVSDPIRVAERIQREISAPFILGNQEIAITASIGIACSNAAYSAAHDLLRDADIAMYRAKVLGKARYEIFDRTMHAAAVARLNFEADLRHAVDRGEFCVHYQPIVSVSDERIVGLEALVRWQHPTRGLLPPEQFIPLAEETGLIVPIGEYVLREACRQIRVWTESFPNDPPLTVSVNLSAKQFIRPDLISRIRRILGETGADPQQIKLELTESAAMENAEHTKRLLSEFKQIGFQLAIDDFGTGYSSLIYLRRFPIDTLKIDRSFVSRMDANSENLEIVRTILELARNLNMDVVAEGAETAADVHHLKDLRCDYAQGFFFSKPLDAESLETLLRQRSRNEAGPEELTASAPSS